MEKILQEAKIKLENLSRRYEVENKSSTHLVYWLSFGVIFLLISFVFTIQNLGGGNQNLEQFGINEKLSALEKDITLVNVNIGSLKEVTEESLVKLKDVSLQSINNSKSITGMEEQIKNPIIQEKIVEVPVIKEVIKEVIVEKIVEKRVEVPVVKEVIKEVIVEKEVSAPAPVTEEVETTEEAAISPEELENNFLNTSEVKALSFEEGALDDYTIVSGDELMTISFKLYGTHRAWPLIKRSNPEISFEILSIDKVIKVPRLKQAETEAAE